MCPRPALAERRASPPEQTGRNPNQVVDHIYIYNFVGVVVGKEERVSHWFALEVERETLSGGDDEEGNPMK